MPITSPDPQALAEVPGNGVAQTPAERVKSPYGLTENEYAAIVSLAQAEAAKYGPLLKNRVDDLISNIIIQAMRTFDPEQDGSFVEYALSPNNINHAIANTYFGRDEYLAIIRKARIEALKYGPPLTNQVSELAHNIILRAARTFDFRKKRSFVAYAHEPVNIQRAIESTLYADDRAKISLCTHCHRRSRDCSCGSRERTGRLLPKSGLCPAGTGMRAPDPDALNRLIAVQLQADLHVALPKLESWQRTLLPSDQQLWILLIGGEPQITEFIRITHTSHEDILTRTEALVAEAARASRVPLQALRAAIQAVNPPRRATRSTPGAVRTHRGVLDVLLPPMGNGPRRKALLDAALRGDATAHTQLRTRYRLTCWTRNHEKIL